MIMGYKWKSEFDFGKGEKKKDLSSYWCKNKALYLKKKIVIMILIFIIVKKTLFFLTVLQ